MKTLEATTTTATKKARSRKSQAKNTDRKPTTKATKPADKTPTAKPAKAAKPKSAKDAARSGSKTAIVLELLRREHGATLFTARNQNEEHDMTEKKIWLITGTGRGLGVDIAKAALATGHAVVATGRDAAKITAAVGDHDNLLVFKLDVTRPQDAEAAVEAAVGKFGRIDVLVNNAGNFFAGFFEELSPEQVRNQIETLLFGPMNVTRAVLPVMRKQRSGLLLTISSTAGIAGQMFCTAYAAAKFGIEGWMESLTPEIAPFGIRTMLVEPGFFRTELLTNDSTTYAKPSIDDYAEKTKEIVAAWKSMDGKQGGDPAKLAAALVKLVALQDPPSRFAAGADAMQTFEAKAYTLLAQGQAHRELSTSLTYDDA